LLAAPSTDPGVRHYRTGLLPCVVTACSLAFARLLAVPAPRRHDSLGSCQSARLCVRSVVACDRFRLANRLPSSPSAARRRALFGTFSGTTQLSDFPGSCISGVRP
jgi:hypothetical protein